jgi:hypothetical protein
MRIARGKLFFFVAFSATTLFGNTAYVENFERSEAKLHTPVWSWVARIETVLKSGGAQIDQPTIVRAIKGRISLGTVSNYEITTALNAVGFNRGGQRCTAISISHQEALVAAALVQELSEKPSRNCLLFNWPQIIAA